MQTLDVLLLLGISMEKPIWKKEEQQHHNIYFLKNLTEAVLPCPIYTVHRQHNTKQPMQDLN